MTRKVRALITILSLSRDLDALARTENKEEAGPVLILHESTKTSDGCATDRHEARITCHCNLASPLPN
jgi:hypothetical protein